MTDAHEHPQTPPAPASAKPPRTWRRRLFLLLFAGVAIYVVLRWFEHNQVYHPTRTLDADPAALGRPFEDAFFPAKDGTQLNAWFFPAETNSARKHLVVLVCHGNGGNISHRLELADALLGTGINVFLLDYRGYGRSQGRPSEQGTYLDSRAAYEWLQKKGFAGTNIIPFGESLGGGVAAELASSVPTAGLILQSTFTSIPDIGADLFPWLPVRWISRIHYDTCSRLSQIRVPVLIMHSRTDDLIRFSHCQKNFAAANEPKILCEISGGHNDPLANRQQFVSGIEQFLALLQR